MLSFFPQIRKEESTYSIFSRLQFALQPPNLETMGKMLFNKKDEVGRLNFQGSFDCLCRKLPPIYTPEKFLYSNTIFPLFIPFISKDKRNRAIEYFKGDFPDRIQKCLGISNVTNTKTYIRICKECIKEDIRNYGESYYRRQHEIELNRMCEKHRIPLYEYNIFPYKIPCRYNDFYTILNHVKEIAIPEKHKIRFLEIADDISYIFNSDLANYDIENTKNKLSSKMFEKGYISSTKLTFQKDFSQGFKEYYTEEFLKYIGFDYDIDENDSWLRHTTTRKKSISNPLKHILVIRYLFNSFKEFYEYNDEHTIFTNGPYPCLNPICDNYTKLVIKNIKISHSHGYLIGIFRCETCGYTYSRRGPDKNNNDLYVKSYVKDYGKLWHDKLRDYIEQGLSMRKIKDILDCSFSCIENHAYKLGIYDLLPKRTKQKFMYQRKYTNDEELTLVKNYKKLFQDLLYQNPQVSKMYFFRNYTSAYMLICKHDKAWIRNNLPNTKKIPTTSDENKQKKRWLEKDELLFTKLLIALDIIKSKNKFHQRITKKLLQKYIGYYEFDKHKDKLPKCIEILNLEYETRSDYQKRRVDFVIKQMIDSGSKISVEKVTYNANLVKRGSKEVHDYIKQKVKTYN